MPKKQQEPAPETAPAALDVKELIREAIAEREERQKGELRRKIVKFIDQKLSERESYIKQKGERDASIAKIDADLEKLAAGDEAVMRDIEKIQVPPAPPRQIPSYFDAAGYCFRHGVKHCARCFEAMTQH
jgi:hypothetical protein